MKLGAYLQKKILWERNICKNENSKKYYYECFVFAFIYIIFTGCKESVKKVKNLIEDKRSNIDSETILQSENNLFLVQQKIDEGRNKLSQDGGDYWGSISSLQEASVIAQQSKYLIDAKTRLGVDIPINISAGR